MVIDMPDKNKINIIMTIGKYYRNGEMAWESHHIGHGIKKIDNQIVCKQKKKYENLGLKFKI